MRIMISLPDHLVSRFLALVPNRERSAAIALLSEQELVQRKAALEQVCLAANAAPVLANEIEAWQGFDDNSKEPQRQDSTGKWGNLMGKPRSDARSGAS